MTNTLSNILTPDQRRALGNVRAAAERIWKAPLHRYYTDHTVAHSDRVIALLDGLTAGMRGTDQRLVPSEAFVLLAAAYLHDVGMQDERFADGDLEAVRAAHHEVTAEWIYRTLEAPETVVDLGLPDDPGLVEAVALVAKAHRRVDLGASDYDPFPHGGETVRPRLLAALLRFGDELDIDHRRVDLALLKLMAPPVESQLHWWKCQYVSGVSIVDEYIRIAYRFPRSRPDYEDLIIPLVETEVRQKLESLEEILRAHSVKVALGKSQVRLMRTVKPMSAEVEALARQESAKGPEAKEQRSEPAPAPPAPQPSRQPPAASTVFDQRGQQVDQQTNVAGDYVDRRPGGSQYHIHIERAEGLAIGDGARAEAPSDVDPVGDNKGVRDDTSTADTGGWNTAAIRDLLSAAFSDGELTTLCFDYFRSVYEDFGTGMGKGQKIQMLLDHSARQQQLDELVQRVKERNPAQYARFEGRLRS
jgi:hypothetical protein